MESNILKKFFEDHHRQWRKKAHSLFQFTCGNLTLHSNYSDWLKHKGVNPPSTTDDPGTPSSKQGRT